MMFLRYWITLSQLVVQVLSSGLFQIWLTSYQDELCGQQCLPADALQGRSGTFSQMEAPPYPTGGVQPPLAAGERHLQVDVQGGAPVVRCTWSSSESSSSSCLRKRFLRVCLSHDQRELSDQPQCTFGEHVAHDVIDDWIFNQPISIQFNHTWQRNFTLILDILEDKERTEFDDNSSSSSSSLGDTVVSRGSSSNSMNVGHVMSRHVMSRHAVRLSLGPSERWTNSNDVTTSSYDVDDVTASRQLTSSLPGVTTSRQAASLQRVQSSVNYAMTSTLQDLMTYKYRVICTDNHYGEGCQEFCRSRDDVFGHYTCSEEGGVEKGEGVETDGRRGKSGKICNPGWTGEYCNRAVCLDGCDTRHGYCERPNECLCRMGWQGTRCTECITYPGCLHGTCSRPWQCECEKGWGGLFCNQNLNYCSTHQPCMNGGTCTNILPGAFHCACPRGFTGVTCTTPASYPPLLSPTPPPAFFSPSTPSHSGGLCDRLRGACLNGATCEDRSGNFLCHCPAGYSGALCQDWTPSTAVANRHADSCMTSSCANGGLCVYAGSKDVFVCVCPPRYVGRDCRLEHDCRRQGCLNGGMCVVEGEGKRKREGEEAVVGMRGGSMTCSCSEHMFGSRCELDNSGRRAILINFTDLQQEQPEQEQEQDQEQDDDNHSLTTSNAPSNRAPVTYSSSYVVAVSDDILLLVVGVCVVTLCLVILILILCRILPSLLARRRKRAQPPLHPDRQEREERGEFYRDCRGEERVVCERVDNPAVSFRTGKEKKIENPPPNIFFIRNNCQSGAVQKTGEGVWPAIKGARPAIEGAWPISWASHERQPLQCGDRKSLTMKKNSIGDNIISSSSSSPWTSSPGGIAHSRSKSDSSANHYVLLTTSANQNIGLANNWNNNNFCTLALGNNMSSCKHLTCAVYNNRMIDGNDYDGDGIRNSRQFDDVKDVNRKTTNNGVASSDDVIQTSDGVTSFDISRTRDHWTPLRDATATHGDINCFFKDVDKTCKKVWRNDGQWAESHQGAWPCDGRLAESHEGACSHSLQAANWAQGCNGSASRWHGRPGQRSRTSIRGRAQLGISSVGRRLSGAN